LDCSKEKKKNKEFLLNYSKKTIDCLPRFDLIEISESISSNERDQLGLIYFPSKSSKESLENSLEFVLFGFNLNKTNGRKELINSMKIFIQIQQNLIEKHFIQMKFVVKTPFLPNEKRKFIGKISSKLNLTLFDLQKRSLKYKKVNQTNSNIELNIRTGDLFLLNQRDLIRNSKLFVEVLFGQQRFLIDIEILLRFNEKIEIHYENIRNSIVKQSENDENKFLVSKSSKTSLNEKILFDFTLKLTSYPIDQMIVSLQNYFSIFSLKFKGKNKFSIEIQNETLIENDFIYLLTIQIENEDFSENLQMKLKFIDSSSESLSRSGDLCVENQRFILFQNSNQSFIKVQVEKTNSNISSFSTFSLISKEKIFVDECEMSIDNSSSSEFILNENQYEICSLTNQCFIISMNKQQKFALKKLLKFRTLELIICIFSLIFILAMLTSMLIICRLRRFQFCLTIKNYLFYGKKYQINQTNRISKQKLTVTLF